MLTFLPELEMSTDCDEDRLGIHSQIAEGTEFLLDVRVVAGIASAVEHLEPGDGAQADLSKLKGLRCRTLECRLIGEQQPAYAHAWSSLIAFQSTVRCSPASAALCRSRRLFASASARSRCSESCPACARRSNSSLRSLTSGQRL